MTHAFGIVAMVAMTPLIIIQLMGLIYSIKQKKSAAIHTEQQAGIIGGVSGEEAGDITVFEEAFNG
jgi:hypothetical protein